MDEWFKFGVVRGLIGLIVATLVSAIFAQLTMGYAYTPIAKEAISGLSVNPKMALIDPTVVAIAYIFGAVIGVLMSGFTYWISAKLCREIGIRAKGIWAPLAVGVLGGLLITIIVGTITSMVVSIVSPAMGAKLLIAMIVGIPIGLIMEAGYVVVTYGLYKYVGWATPEL